MHHTFYNGDTSPITNTQNILRATGRKIKSLTNSPIDEVRDNIHKYMISKPRARSYVDIDNKIELNYIRDFVAVTAPPPPLKPEIDNENINAISKSDKRINNKIGDVPSGESDAESARRIENIIFLVRFCNNIYNDIYMYADTRGGTRRDFVLKINDYKFNIGADMLPANQKYSPTVKIIPAFVHRSKKYKILSKRNKYDLRRICLEILLCGEIVIDPTEVSAELVDILRDNYEYEYINSEPQPLIQLFDILACCQHNQHHQYRFYIK